MADAPKTHQEKVRQDRREENLSAVGKFIIPEETTWAAYAEVVRDNENELYFSPKNYAYFDGVIARKLGNPAIYDTNHPNWEQFEGLRTNLEVIRNFVLKHYLDSGIFNGGDEKQLPRLKSLANAIGEALSNDTWAKRPFTRSLNLDVANVEGVGAAEIYKHLLEIQETPEVPSFLKPALHNFKDLLNMPDRVWELAPLEQSPFSLKNLSAPPPSSKDQKTETNPADPESQKRDQEEKDKKTAEAKEAENKPKSTDPIEQSIEITESIVKLANKLQPIDTLAEAPREESIDEARKILRWLRNMEFTERNMEEFMSQGSAETVVAKKQSVQKLVGIFSAHLRHAQHANANVARDNPSVANARDTATTMALEVAEHTRQILPDNHPKEAFVDSLIDSLPPESLLRQDQPFSKLLDTMELGLERASGRQVEKSAVDRLIEMGNRAHKAANALHSPKPSTEPAQQESIELARAMLNRLKNLSYGDQPIEEFIKNGSAEEKAAFAQQVTEMVETYQHMVEEAQELNPEFALDERVQKANTAVGQFACSVKLMAAKEIPNSMAATQQISADVAQMPGQWSELSNRTVDRLIKSAEGGLEKALDDLAMEQDDQEEDLMKEAIEDSLQHTETSKRKKKRRRGGGDSKKRSGKGGKRQRKQHIDLTSDDYILKQGRFAEDSRATRSHNPDKADVSARIEPSSSESRESRSSSRRESTPEPATAMQGLRPEDLAAIRQLGGSLRNMGNQLRDISASTTNVTMNDKITPDDKTLNQRMQDQQQQQQNNPRGTNGPRV